jgi:hypothetical protein
MGVMRTEPQPSDREVLAGLVERVTYQNAKNGFCVIRVKARGPISSRSEGIADHRDCWPVERGAGSHPPTFTC